MVSLCARLAEVSLGSRTAMLAVDVCLASLMSDHCCIVTSLFLHNWTNSGRGLPTQLPFFHLASTSSSTLYVLSCHRVHASGRWLSHVRHALGELARLWLQCKGSENIVRESGGHYRGGLARIRCFGAITMGTMLHQRSHANMTIAIEQIPASERFPRPGRTL